MVVEVVTPLEVELLLTAFLLQDSSKLCADFLSPL